jgi:hypothetical protein
MWLKNIPFLNAVQHPPKRWCYPWLRRTFHYIQRKRWVHKHAGKTEILSLYLHMFVQLIDSYWSNSGWTDNDKEFSCRLAIVCKSRFGEPALMPRPLR